MNFEHCVGSQWKKTDVEEKTPREEFVVSVPGVFNWILINGYDERTTFGYHKRLTDVIITRPFYTTLPLFLPFFLPCFFPPALVRFLPFCSIRNNRTDRGWVRETTRCVEPRYDEREHALLVRMTRERENRQPIFAARVIEKLSQSQTNQHALSLALFLFIVPPRSNVLYVCYGVSHHR